MPVPAMPVMHEEIRQGAGQKHVTQKILIGAIGVALKTIDPKAPE
jgi:hypothetical protein